MSKFFLVLFTLLYISISSLSLLGMEEEYRHKRDMILKQEHIFEDIGEQRKNALLERHQKFLEWESSVLKEQSYLGFGIAALASCFIPAISFYQNNFELSTCQQCAGACILCGAICISAKQSVSECCQAKQNTKRADEVKKLIESGKKIIKQAKTVTIKAE